MIKLRKKNDWMFLFPFLMSTNQKKTEKTKKDPDPGFMMQSSVQSHIKMAISHTNFDLMSQAPHNILNATAQIHFP